MSPIPTLDQIAAQPALAAELPPAITRALALRCVVALAALVPWMVGDPLPGRSSLELLSLEEAAGRLRMPLATLRGRANVEPYRSLRGSNGTRYVCFRSDLLEAFIHSRTLGPQGDLVPATRRKPLPGGPAPHSPRRERGGAVQ